MIEEIVKTTSQATDIEREGLIDALKAAEQCCAESKTEHDELVRLAERGVVDARNAYAAAVGKLTAAQQARALARRDFHAFRQRAAQFLESTARPPVSSDSSVSCVPN